MTAAYLTQSDLVALVGAERVTRLFDDDGSGTLGTDETTILGSTLEAAEAEATSRLMRGWDKASITTMAATDLAFRRHVAWVALEFASERRPEFCGADGKGAFYAQYERAIKYFEQLANGRIRSAAESTAGKSTAISGEAHPQPPAYETDQFVFAPSAESPDGHGDF